MNAMKKLILLSALLAIFVSHARSEGVPESYKHVDQIFWVVSDVDRTIEYYKKLGFSQFADLGTVHIESKNKGSKCSARLVRANLGGAQVNWIQPITGNSIFHEFYKEHGEGAMSLVHRFPAKKEMKKELKRLSNLGVGVLEKISITAGAAEMEFVFLNTAEKGKYTLGFVYENQGMETFEDLQTENRNGLTLNQYAFAILDPAPVSEFWQSLGLPELEIRHPELGDPMYYGEPADHDLIQGWQRHGDISYEWCIPVKPPIVYDDHIKLHGEGIHHLAFSVADMDQVLDDYTDRDFVVSMGGTWGEKGKPGSGRYEYIDLEKAGGLTMELLWNYKE
jgi:catechol 2,3-dioxygenase-like lactoylglutathione lyase family enzyme